MKWMPERRAEHQFLVAGLVDSFGLSLGWTAFTLIAVERFGLGAAALYNAAMLVGIVISAPATMWLSRYLNGASLLRVVGVVELPLRLLTLAGLVLDQPSWAIASAVVVMNVAAWTGYAGMRAEVADRAPGSHAMVRYAVAIASIEAVAASVAALLPVTDQGTAGRIALTAIFVVYAVSLAPQFWCARYARVASGRQLSAARSDLVTLGGELHRPAPAGRTGMPLLLLAGTAVMLIASGPATLNTALAADMYGQLSVVAASIAFTAGCLCASRVNRYVSALPIRTATLWTAWGLGMLVGWLAAPWSLGGLLVAQLLSGLCLTAFHGEMDSAVATFARPERLTTLLAVAGALRAIGSAVAVRLLPLLISSISLIWYVVGLMALLAAGRAALALVGAHSHLIKPDADGGLAGSAGPVEIPANASASN